MTRPRKRRSVTRLANTSSRPETFSLPLAGRTMSTMERIFSVAAPVLPILKAGMSWSISTAKMKMSARICLQECGRLHWPLNEGKASVSADLRWSNWWLRICAEAYGNVYPLDVWWSGVMCSLLERLGCYLDMTWYHELVYRRRCRLEMVMSRAMASIKSLFFGITNRSISEFIISSVL